MSLHGEGLVIPFKDQEAKGGGVPVAQRVGMYRIRYTVKYSLRH